jgi:hypothetical protein
VVLSYLNLAFLTDTSSPHFFTYSYLWFLLITALTFRMFDTGETLEDIERWAEARFPHEFKAVKDYLRDNDITVQDHLHEDKDVCTLVRSVHVGHAGHVGTNVVPVIAHVAFQENEPEPWVDLCFTPVDGNYCDFILMNNIIFKEPFCWLNPGKSDFRVLRFDALIQFICPPSELAAGASIDVRDFKELFESACRVIAMELEDQRGLKGKYN